MTTTTQTNKPIPATTTAERHLGDCNYAKHALATKTCGCSDVVALVILA